MKTYKDYYKYAKRLAIKWRYSKQRIKEKLLYKGANASMSEKIISSLTEDMYIDDNKASELDIFIMEGKRYGYKRVKEYLIAKGYPKNIVDSYIYNKDIEIDNCYFHFTKGINRYKNYKYSDVEREKLINYLKRCGFNDKIIFEVVRSGINYENVKWICWWWTHLRTILSI